MSRRGIKEGTIIKRKTCKACKKITSTTSSKDLRTCKNCGNKLPDKCTWMAQGIIGTDLKTGKSKRKSFYGKTRKEALDKLQDARQEVKNGIYIEPTKYLLKDWIEKWLVNYKKGDLKASSYDSYENRFQVHIKPDLGEIPLSKLQTHMIQDFYTNKLKNGRNDGKGGLSEISVKHLHIIISKSLDQAVQEGLLPINVAKAAKPPKVKRKKIRIMDLDSIKKFIDYVRGDRMFAAYLLAITTGLRRGELLGLCWDCVDLDNRTISVERQLLALREGMILDEGTKSKPSRRSIILTVDAVEALRKHKDEQDKKRKLLSGSGYQNHNLVFCRDDGSFLDPRDFTKRFQRQLEKANLTKIRLHDLRHSHASLLLMENTHPKVVQERLGHSSIVTTLDLYSHVSKGLQEKAAESLDGLFSKKKETPR